MANFPEFNGFSLNDLSETGVITSNILKGSTPDRSIEVEQVSRRSGGRVLNSEFQPKKVSIQGYVIGNNAEDLRDKVDSLHSNVTSQREGVLAVSSDRQATALVEKVNITENPYNTDYLPFTIDFVLPDPFFYAGQHTATFTLPSGTNIHTTPVTISGSYYALPALTINVADNVGETITSRVDITYESTGERVTWSGASGEINLDYSDILQFDFDSQLITRNSTIQNTAGTYADFYPGTHTLTITFSGSGNWIGGDATLSYQPRYF